MSNHYDDHYNVIIVGSGVAGAIDRQGQGGS
jgi:choline dehydrogenase-like flavoprotein